MNQLLSGNEAAARGIFEAGIRICAAYPGTPSTEILETVRDRYHEDVYAEWAPNEKVAFEVAFGAAIAGTRSLTAMKMVGLNVAADPLFTSAYLGVGAGFVIVSADDPSMHSSQNEQDNRHYARAAKIPMLEPADSQECKDFMKEAVHISEQFDTPVLYRVTTRIDHSKSLVELGEREEAAPVPYKRDPRKYVASPANAYRKHPELEARLLAMEAYSCASPLNRVEMNGSSVGVIAAGAAYQYAKEVFPEDTSFLKIGMSWPLPMALIREFAAKVEKLYVIEELDPFMENEIRAAGIDCIGHEVTGLCHELNTQVLRERVFGVKPETIVPDKKAVSRPPAFCPGCPHRGFFYTMAQHKDWVVAGDIGCYTLGASAPLQSMDTCICMGAGYSAGAGMAKAFELQGDTKRKVFGVMGDSTFFHSGLTGASEIIYNKAHIIPCILDNRITGMTGHQENPGSGYTLMGEPADAISMEKVLEAIGYQKIIVADPQDLEGMEAACQEALASEVPAAIIVRRPCLLIKRYKFERSLCKVDPDLCMSCQSCLSVGCPAISFRDGQARIDENLCVGCTVCAQVCPFGAISREE